MKKNVQKTDFCLSSIVNPFEYKLLVVLFFTFKLTVRRVFYNLNIAIFFQIVFEGIVGKNSLGNIAIDDISVAPGVCPSKCFVNIVIWSEIF